jgi:hypothetical protein
MGEAATGVGRQTPVVMPSRLQPDDDDRSRRYRVTVGGRLSDRFAAAFDGVAIRSEAGKTTLEGDFVDAAQLYGLLERLRDLGLVLVGVEELR